MTFSDFSDPLPAHSSVLLKPPGLEEGSKACDYINYIPERLLAMRRVANLVDVGSGYGAGSH